MTQSPERPPSLTEAQLEGLRRLSEAVGTDQWVFGGDSRPGESCLGRATRKGRDEELRWTLTEQEAELAADALCALPSLLSSLREARALLHEAVDWIEAAEGAYGSPSLSVAARPRVQRIRAFLGSLPKEGTDK